MTKITIKDTGFLTSDKEGTAKSGSDINDLGSYIVNSGVAITINCPKISLKGGTNLSDDPNPSSNDASKTSFNTFDNEVYEVPFIISAKDTSESNLVKEIRALYKTLGVKLLYSSDTATNLKMLPELIGRTDTRFNTGGLLTIPLIVCRAVGVQIDSRPSKKYAIRGKITFKEEKVIPK